MQATITIPDKLVQKFNLSASTLDWATITMIVKTESKESLEEKIGVLYPMSENELTEADLKLIEEMKNTPRSQLHNI